MSWREQTKQFKFMSLVHSTQQKYWTLSSTELDELKKKVHASFDSRISIANRELVLIYFEKKILEEYGRNQKFPDKVVVYFRQDTESMQAYSNNFLQKILFKTRIVSI